MKNSLQGASFSTKNKNKTYSSIPNLEGFSNSQVYTDVYKMLSQSVDYEECKKNTEKNCNEYKFYQVDKVQNELDEIEKEKEKANQELMFCQSQTTSCKQLFDEITTKTKEFDELHNDLMKQEKKINRCKHKKNECDSYQKKIQDLENLITTYEKEIMKLEKKAKKLFC